MADPHASDLLYLDGLIEQLRKRAENVNTFWLKSIGKRIRERRGHFMPPHLLDSQFATLEPLAPDEAGAVLDVSASPEDLIAEAVRIVTGLRNAQA